MADTSERQAKNMQLIEQLDADGFGLDPLHMLKFRLDVLTEHLVAAKVVNSDTLETEWETQLGELLESVSAEVRKHQLLAE